MQQSEFPTLAQIETLIAYLRRLYAEGFEPIESWDGGKKQSDGSLTMPYPTYNPLVENFSQRFLGRAGSIMNIILNRRFRCSRMNT